MVSSRLWLASLPGMSKARDGLSQAHMDVLVAFPGRRPATGARHEP